MVILLVLATLLLLVAVPLVIDNRDLLLDRLHGRTREHDAGDDQPLPFLIVPVSRDDVEVDALPAGVVRGGGGLPWQPRGESLSRWAAPSDDAEEEHPFRSVSTSTPDGVSEEELLGAKTVVFRPPSEEPVQILPGRLEIVAGEPARDDLRFFGRIGEPVRITLGREVGSPQRTIALHSPTVSRRHARLEFVEGRWYITNLSRTNPLLVNERVLAADGSVPCVLAEGDRIELGEVVLRFHER